MGKDLANVQSYQDMIKALDVFSDEVRTNTNILSIAANTCVANMGSDNISTKYATQLNDEIVKFERVFSLIESLSMGLQTEMKSIEEVVSEIE